MINLEKRIKNHADEIAPMLVVVRARFWLPHNAIMHQHPASVTTPAVGSIIWVIATKRGIEEIKADINGEKYPASDENPFDSEAHQF